MTWAVTVCKNRLSHLQRTLPQWLDRLPFVSLVVDYDCDEHTADWVDSLGHPNARTLRVKNRPVWKKTEALNLGGAEAVRNGAQRILFLDADTGLSEEFWPYVAAHVPADHFAIIEPTREKYDAMGLLLCPARSYVEGGGFDERMRGWGGEDMDMRLRLYLKMKLPFVELPGRLVEPIPHSRELRAAGGDVRGLESAHDRNLGLMHENVRRWMGKHLAEIDDPRMHRLMLIRSKEDFHREHGCTVEEWLVERMKRCQASP